MNKILFSLISSAINQKPLNESDKAMFSKEQLPELFDISRKHDISHLLALAIKKNALIEETKELDREIYSAAFRYEQINYEYTLLCDALENAKIPFIPLKGSVIRQYYPEPWMRTSCDIDVLVDENDADIASKYLCKYLGYTLNSNTSHDISLFSKNGIHIELHYTLTENEYFVDIKKILDIVWNNCELKKGYSYWYKMNDEMFYFYHIAHMAKHFENGGCGIRPFIDLWILDNTENKNTEKREALLKSGGLLRFFKVCQSLYKAWFENENMDLTSEQLQKYILQGGLYGSLENRVLIQQNKKGGQVSYILYRIFMPYDLIKYQYPILQKQPLLTPIMEVHRWFRLLFGKCMKKSISELKNSNLSKTDTENLHLFLKNIGLNQ